MRRGYHYEVYARVPADRVEDRWQIHPVMTRFDDSGLHDNENEN